MNEGGYLHSADAPRQQRHVWLGVLFVAALLAIAVLGAWRLKGVSTNIACQQRLKLLYIWVVQPDGTLYVDHDLSQLTTSVHRPGPIPELVCPACGELYVYQLLHGRVIYGGSDPQAIMWCPGPCHRGRRNVLLENGAVISKVPRNRSSGDTDNTP